MAAVAALALTLAAPAPSHAQARATRVTFSFAPAAPLTSTTVDVASEGRQWLPSLKLSGSGSPVRLGGWSLPLPSFGVRSVSFAPRYGDHAVALGFQSSSLPDMGLSARRVSGIAVASKGPRFSTSFVVGRSENTRSLNPIASPVPQLLAASATVAPRRGLALTPRLVAPLVRSSTPTEFAFGSGARVELSPQLTITADAGASRARGQWAPSAIAGASGRWRRAVFEVASGHIAPGVTLLGPVPFAGSRRFHSNVRMELARGVSAEAQVRSLNGIAARASRSVDRLVSLRVDRLSPGALQLKLSDGGTESRGARGVELEWRERSARGVAVQFEQQHERGGSAGRMKRSLQVEVPRIPGTGKLALMVRSSLRLAPHSSDPRSATYLAARAKSGPIGLAGELWVDAGSRRSMVRVGRLISRLDVALPTGSTLQVRHEYLPGERASTWRRLQFGVAHTVDR